MKKIEVNKSKISYKEMIKHKKTLLDFDEDEGKGEHDEKTE